MMVTMKPAKSFIKLDSDLSIPNAVTSLQPVQPIERIPALDILRGFALCGVLVAYTLWNLGSPAEDTYSNADRMLNWVLAAFYSSLLLLLLQRDTWQQWLAPLGAVGRMALTNYILQAAIIVPVCIGFNLFDRVTPSLGVLLALAVWSVQVPASVLWLRHFRFGPAEWIWRSLTYGYAQPMRVANAPAVAVSA